MSESVAGKRKEVVYIPLVRTCKKLNLHSESEYIEVKQATSAEGDKYSYRASLMIPSHRYHHTSQGRRHKVASSD